MQPLAVVRTTKSMFNLIKYHLTCHIQDSKNNTYTVQTKTAYTDHNNDCFLH
uniref:Uncharacterized protein n=1 Tax=Arion vulgaris TaxID=1028688 RepID=A0A0B7AP77_9EUPU